MKDAEALTLLKSGNQDALEYFIDKYSAYVGTVVNSILQGSMSREDAEEVTADVFVTLWKSAENLYPLNLKGYLSRVARNLSMQKLRGRFEVLPLDEDILILDEDSVFGSLEKEDQASILRNLVYSMPQPDKEIFLRFYYYCQSVSVISKQMQMNPSTIKTRLRRGREQLRHHLNNIGHLKGGDLHESKYS